MKTVPLTVRRCPAEVHQALKKSARANHRSVNGETLTWLEKQASTANVMTGKEVAAVLRRFQKALSRADRIKMAEGIEEARRRMANEHLH